ncbi:hypothetical protein ACN20G_33285 (plasmid) [Streptomyces sp. BI20]|uniref:hypothetical protein n=1 Tax=Streptomyces sp. BI20 TaxID=3403460 RepID=UPI003C724CC0
MQQRLTAEAALRIAGHFFDSTAHHPETWIEQVPPLHAAWDSCSPSDQGRILLGCAYRARNRPPTAPPGPVGDNMRLLMGAVRLTLHRNGGSARALLNDLEHARRAAALVTSQSRWAGLLVALHFYAAQAASPTTETDNEVFA